MPQYWLLKSEPSAYSYSDLQKEGQTVWDGVTNNLALKHLRSMKKGDLAFIYHSGKEKSMVGLAEVISGPYPDPERDDPRIVVVDLKAKAQLHQAVSLADVKNDPFFGDFPLVRMPRLSVIPVNSAQWKRLLKMAGS